MMDYTRLKRVVADCGFEQGFEFTAGVGALMVQRGWFMSTVKSEVLKVEW
jgi:hypothetical protein